MKLLFCPKCQDIFSLKQDKCFCSCKASAGHYDDKINTTYYGDAIPIGINNSSFVNALSVEVDNKIDWGVGFEAFVIPETSNHITVGKSIEE